MPEPIEWLDDGTASGTPFNPRFGDRYRSELGGLEQARNVFLAGCGLPAAWSGQALWRVLETGFGLGLNFLVTWAAWKADPLRPKLLHFVSTEAFPASAQDVLRGAADHAEPVGQRRLPRPAAQRCCRTQPREPRRFMGATPLLEVHDLRVTLATPRGPADALRGISFAIERGQTLGLIGESGCGKSITALALMGLLPDDAQASGSLRFDGRSCWAWLRTTGASCAATAWRWCSRSR